MVIHDMQIPTDYEYFQSGREDSNLRPLDPQSSDSSLSGRNCILPPPLETATNCQEEVDSGSEIQSPAESSDDLRLELEDEFVEPLPLTLIGFRFDPATSGAWTREAEDWAATAAERQARDEAPPAAETTPCPPPNMGLLGQKFGKLTVILELPGKRGVGSICECVCDCGNHRTVFGSELRKKHVRSCGCLRRNGKKVTP